VSIQTNVQALFPLRKRGDVDGIPGRQPLLAIKTVAISELLSAVAGSYT
jgi:hypothetical protein